MRNYEGINREQTRGSCYGTVQTSADLLGAQQPVWVPAAGCPARLGKGHRAASPPGNNGEGVQPGKEKVEGRL